MTTPRTMGVVSSSPLFFEPPPPPPAGAPQETEAPQTRAVRVVGRPVEALVAVAEEVAVDVGLARALADVEVAGRRLAGRLVPLAAVVLRDPVLHAVDADADARAVGEAVGPDAEVVVVVVGDPLVPRGAVEEVDVVLPGALVEVDDVERVLEAVVAVHGPRRVARAVGDAVGDAERRARDVVQMGLEDAALAGRHQRQPLLHAC